MWLMRALGIRYLQVLTPAETLTDLAQTDVNNKLLLSSNDYASSNKEIDNIIGNSLRKGVECTSDLVNLTSSARLDNISTRQLKTVLGDDQFQMMLQHLMLGFPLIFRADNTAHLVVSVLLPSIKILLPSFLHHLITVWNTTDESVLACYETRNQLAGNYPIDDMCIGPLPSTTLKKPFGDCQDTRNASEDRFSVGPALKAQPGSDGLLSPRPYGLSTVSSPRSLSCTLSSTPSLEVYDALHIDSLMLDILPKLKQDRCPPLPGSGSEATVRWLLCWKLKVQNQDIYHCSFLEL